MVGTADATTDITHMTTSEHHRLTQLESVIGQELNSFVRVGLALAEIRDARLHRETHRTFGEYCRDRWDLGQSHAFRLINAATVVENLSPTGDILPANEYQARLLTRLSVDDQRKVWTEVVHKAPRGKVTYRLVEAVVRQHLDGNGRSPRFSSLIKPSDNWNFSRVAYKRVDNARGHGYVPGEMYVNCFWYYVKPGDLIVDPMAAAGMAKIVYDHRADWMGKHHYDFELRLFDLSPQSPHVVQHDLLTGFPVDKADYIIIDPPYYGIAKGQYSNNPSDLANMALDEWTAAIFAIAGHCATAQQAGALCTIVAPNFRDVKTQRIVLVTEIIRQAWESAGYGLHDKAYASRRIQRKQNTRMAAVNNAAKASRVMLTDIAEILTFRRCDQGVCPPRLADQIIP